MPVSWNGTAWSSPGTLSIAFAATASVTSGSISAGTFLNQGNVTFPGFYGVINATGGRFVNSGTMNFNAPGPGAGIYDGSDGQFAFTDNGTINVTTGTVEVDGLTGHMGQIHLTAGSLTLRPGSGTNGATSLGKVTVNAGSVFDLAASQAPIPGSWLLPAGQTINGGASGPGTLAVGGSGGPVAVELAGSDMLPGLVVRGRSTVLTIDAGVGL